jgi:hypothetical protein
MNSTLKTTLQASLILSLLILSAGLANAHTQKAITVQGTNTYPQDVVAVQMALNQYDVVTLSGTFDFGQAVFGVDWEAGQAAGIPAGIAYVTRPNVVLQGDKQRGATIVGGGAPFSSEYFYVWPAIAITAPGVTVRGLVMSGSPDTGIFFLGSPQTATGKKLTIEANTISADWAAVYLRFTGGLRAIVNRNRLLAPDSAVPGATPLEVDWSGYTRDTNGELVPGKGSVEITNNEISAQNQNVGDGILVWGWRVGSWLGHDLPTDWGDNGPMTISGNILTMDCMDGWCTGIQVGRSAMGVNHAQVFNNTIKGSAAAGIDKWPYGHDNLIAQNDLGELTTLFEQIGVWARGTTVAYNRLGPVLNAPALWMTSINWHPYPDPLDTPMPLPTEHCFLFENDYRLTGVPGGSMFTAAILIDSEADLGWYTGLGTEVRYNFIAEIGKFPDGTGPNEQIYQLIVGDEPLVHDNWILGLSQPDGVSAPSTQSFDKPFRPMAQERVRRLQNQPWKEHLTGKPIGPQF